MRFKGISKFFLLLLIFYTFCIKASFAAPSCIPKDHTSDANIQVSHIFDNIVGLISDILFGKRNGVSANANIFNKYESDFGDRQWNNGLVHKMFISTVTDGRFQAIIYLAIILSVSYLGIAFAMGFKQMTAGDFLAQLIKVGIIITFTTQSGWDVYLELIVRNVLDSARYLNRVIIASMYNVNISQVTSPFEPIDMVLSFILNGDTWNKIFALMWSQGFIFILLLLIVIGFTSVIVFIMTAKVAVIYMVVITLSAVLLSIGPIFFVLLLFDQTKDYFQKWFSAVIGAFFQQYMLFIGFFIFCVILTGMLKGLFYFETCWSPVMFITMSVAMPNFIIDIIQIFVDIIRILSFGFIKMQIDLPEHIIWFRIPIVFGYALTASTSAVFLDLFAVLSLFITAMIFGNFIDQVAELGSDIAGSSLGASKIASESSLYKGLQQLQTKAASAAGSMAKDVATGEFVFKGARGVASVAGWTKGKLEAGSQALASYQERKLAQMSKDAASGKTTAGSGFLSKMADKASKITDKALVNSAGALSKTAKAGATGMQVVHKASSAVGSIVQSTDTMNELRAIESNQAMMTKFVEKELKENEKQKIEQELEKLATSKGLSSVKELDKKDVQRVKDTVKNDGPTIDEQKKAFENAKDKLQKEGHSGMFQKVQGENGKTILKELPMSDNPAMMEMIQKYEIRKTGIKMEQRATLEQNNNQISDRAGNKVADVLGKKLGHDSKVAQNTGKAVTQTLKAAGKFGRFVQKTTAFRTITNKATGKKDWW